MIKRQSVAASAALALAKPSRKDTLSGWRLKFGDRGDNQPVRNEVTQNVEIQ